MNQRMIKLILTILAITFLWQSSFTSACVGERLASSYACECEEDRLASEDRSEDKTEDRQVGLAQPVMLRARAYLESRRSSGFRQGIGKEDVARVRILARRLASDVGSHVPRLEELINDFEANAEDSERREKIATEMDQEVETILPIISGVNTAELSRLEKALINSIVAYIEKYDITNILVGIASEVRYNTAESLHDSLKGIEGNMARLRDAIRLLTNFNYPRTIYVRDPGAIDRMILCIDLEASAAPSTTVFETPVLSAIQSAI